jgi:hypothetical protein
VVTIFLLANYLLHHLSLDGRLFHVRRPFHRALVRMGRPWRVQLALCQYRYLAPHCYVGVDLHGDVHGRVDHCHRKRDDLRQHFRLALQDGVIDEDEEEEIEAVRKKLSSDVACQIRNEMDAVRRENGACTCPRCRLNFTAVFSC